MSSAMEFGGTGDPELYPAMSKQQIMAKLVDMFGDGDRKVMFNTVFVNTSTRPICCVGTAY